MKPKIIVIDGPDGSGKETQSKLLLERLNNAGIKAAQLSFPRYESDASLFEKKYLDGEYGNTAEDINPYETSVLFAVDRYDYFKKYDEDYDVLICDRYTTSNMIHQGEKLKEGSERDAYISWLKDLEYNKLGIPEPDHVVFLDLDPEISQKLIEKRKQTTDHKEDIHEKNKDYLKKVYETAKKVAEQENWDVVTCYDQGEIRSIEAIQEDLYNKVKDVVEEITIV